MRYLSSRKTLRVAVALSLAFWVAGIGCAFGCESFAMAGPDESIGRSQATAGAPAEVAAESCSMQASHSCCPKHRASSARGVPSSKRAPSDSIRAKGVMGPHGAQLVGQVAIQSAGGMVHECPLAMNGTALASTARTDESVISIAFEPGASPLANVGRLAVSAAPSFYSNRGHTYLRCCVFLI